MIGWENNQGAYFVQKLQEQIDSNATDIGTMSNLKTTADTLVGGINEVVDEVGDMSDLTTTADTLVGAIEEVKDTADDCSVIESYRCLGEIIKSKTGTCKAYGMATIYRNGNSGRIDFEAKFTTAGTSDSAFDVVLSRDLLVAIDATLPSFEAVTNGSVHYISSSGGTLNNTLEGYAGVMAKTDTAEWQLSRLYNTSGSIGGWADISFAANMMVFGSVPIKFT